MEQEQSDEVEVLMSIFPDEFELVTQSPWNYMIHIIPNPGGKDNHVGVALCCKYPSDYPTVVPDVSIVIEKGLGKKHLEELTSLVQKVAEDNIGSPSIFAITEAVKEWLIDNNVAGQDGSMYADMMRKQQQKDVEVKKKAERVANLMAAEADNKKDLEDPAEIERIRRRQAGHPVTLESFNAWKTKFDAEMDAIKVKQGYVDVNKDDDRPTGKQLFMLNKAGKEDILIEEGEKEEISADYDVSATASSSGKKMSGGGISGSSNINDIELLEDDDDDEDYADDGEDDDDDEDYDGK